MSKNDFEQAVVEANAFLVRHNIEWTNVCRAAAVGDDCVYIQWDGGKASRVLFSERAHKIAAIFNGQVTVDSLMGQSEPFDVHRKFSRDRGFVAEL